MHSSKRTGSSILEKRDVDLLDHHTDIAARDARANFSRVIKAARYDDEKIVITDHGEPAAALVPIKDLRVLDLLDNLGLLNTIRERRFEEVTLGDLQKIIEGELVSSDDTEDVGHVPNRRSRSS